MGVKAGGMDGGGWIASTFSRDFRPVLPGPLSETDGRSVCR